MKEEQNSDYMPKTGVSKPNNYKAITDPVTGETHSLAEWSIISIFHILVYVEE